MSYAKLALVLLQVVNAVLKWINDKRLLEAGEAQAIAKAVAQAEAEVSRARQAADAADAKAGGDVTRVDPAIFEDGK